MTIGLDDLDIFPDINGYINWAIETGIWNGRPVSTLEASDFAQKVFANILHHLHPNDPSGEHFAVQLAWLGTSDATLLARDIKELEFLTNDLILQAGFKKSVKKFWKKHKTEILIGALVVAVVTVAVVVAVSSAGTATGAAAAEGGAALKALDKDKCAKKPVSQSTSAPPPQNESASLPPSNTQIVFEPDGIIVGNTFTSYDTIIHNQPTPTASNPPLPPFGEKPNPWLTYTPPSELQALPPASPPKYTLPPSQIARPQAEPLPQPTLTNTSPPFATPNSWLAQFVSDVGKNVIDNPDLFNPNSPSPTYEGSHVISTLGRRNPDISILGGNGMDTSLEGAIDHANSLASFSQGYAVDWVYNRSHGKIVDVLEIVSLNLNGRSPVTADCHQALWTDFAEKNAHRPNAKVLQICHSQDTIHVLNALRNPPPPEIQQRHLNFWLRNIKNLTAFCTGTNDLTKPRPTSIEFIGVLLHQGSCLEVGFFPRDLAGPLTFCPIFPADFLVSFSIHRCWGAYCY